MSLHLFMPHCWGSHVASHMLITAICCQFPESGAILVFMPGYAEIQTLFDMLQSSPVFGVRFRHK